VTTADVTATEIAALVRAVAAYGLPGSLLERPQQPLGTEDWSALLGEVRRQRLSGLLVQAVVDGALPAHDLQVAEAVDLHTRAMASTVLLESTLLDALDAMSAAGVEARVLKGSAVAHLDYPDPALRSFGDVDLLVRSDDVDTAVTALTEAGCRRRYPQPRPGFDAHFGKGASFWTPTGEEIDLHRTFAMGPWGLKIQLEDLWSGEPSTFRLAGRAVRALGAEERFMHACYHTVLGDSPPRLVPQRDVAQMILNGRINTDRVHDLVAAWNGEAVVAEAVRTTWQTLGIADVVELSAWAAGYVPSPRERHDLEVYVEGKASYAAKSAAAVRAIPGVRRKLSFLMALTFPKRSYLADRHSGLARRLGQGMAQVFSRGEAQ
jgi:hypothetical protein